MLFRSNQNDLNQHLKEIKTFNEQQQLPEHLLLVLKQISLLIETLPELLKLRQTLLSLAIQ